MYVIFSLSLFSVSHTHTHNIVSVPSSIAFRESNLGTSSVNHTCRLYRIIVKVALSAVYVRVDRVFVSCTCSYAPRELRANDMASDLSSGCMETIDILDDEKEEGEISLEDVSSSEEGGMMGRLTCGYVVGRTRKCPSCKSWPECASWCATMYHSKSKRGKIHF